MPAASVARVELWLVRHGETAWSKQRRHTGRTDVPLTDDGRRQARALRPVLAVQPWDAVLCSPLSRARETAELALPNVSPTFDDDLVERDYGPTEGISSAELRRTDPDWDTWRTTVAGAETIDEVGDRVDRVIARVTGTGASVAEADRRASGADARVTDGAEAPNPADAAPASPPLGEEAAGELDAEPGRRVLLVAHGHLLRVLAARWIGQPAVVGSGLALDVGSTSVLGYEHDRRVIVRWNVRD